ncbi:zinc finger protein 436-like isoform X1 [Salarias fasciatus]|uniref:zinc finger protein 436-like isoform X1 n=1 Tax=Salarias fasciatus TaxID=181472 RepID=UPI001176C932|nr:zinc finger protein 436-like isoform X1 [Salarias fasciatus]
MNQKMSSIPTFRDFICDRLSAAAEEIFRMFEKTVLEYEEALGRQRRPLDTESKPQTHGENTPLIHPSSETQELSQQQEQQGQIRINLQPLSNSSLAQGDPESAYVREEHEHPCTSQDEERLAPKRAITQTVIYDNSGQHEEPTFCMGHDGSHSKAEELPLGNIVVKSSEVLNLNTDYQLHPCYSSETHNIADGHFGESEAPSNTPPIKKSYKCETCGKILNSKKHFSRHQRIHTGERPFPCDLCDKKFNRKEDLMVHRRTHTGEKPYSCDMCEKNFSRKKSLVSHRRTHTGEKPFSCDVCGKKFNRKSNVRVHRRIHTGEKPFTCDTCGKCFISSSVLKKHRRKHTGETQLSCLTGEETFSEASGGLTPGFTHTDLSFYDNKS